MSAPSGPEPVEAVPSSGPDGPHLVQIWHCDNCGASIPIALGYRSKYKHVLCGGNYRP